MDSYQVMSTSEAMDLPGDQPSVRVQRRGIQHDEIVVGVLVDLGALAAPQRIFESELVKSEFRAQQVDVVRGGVLDVQPDQVPPVAQQLVDLARIDLARSLAGKMGYCSTARDWILGLVGRFETDQEVGGQEPEDGADADHPTSLLEGFGHGSLG